MNNFVCQKFNILLVVFAFLAAVNVSAQIVSNDFEKDTQGWEARGTDSISSSKDEFVSGKKSLKVSGRKEFWQGAQLNVTKILKPNTAYKFSLSIKLGKGEKPDDVKMTMQKGDTGYETVAAANANADGWTTLSGRFKPAGGEPYLLVYIEAARPNTSYFIDDFKIESLGDEIPVQTGELLKNDFEDMTAQNWFVRGDAVQIFSSNAAGSQSLKVTGRAKNYEGVGLDVSPLIFKGRTYDVSVSVRLLKGQPKDLLKMTMLQTPPTGDPKYIEINTPKEVSDAEWTTLSGKYTGTTSENNLVIYVEGAGATTSFYIDNFTISVAAATAAANNQTTNSPTAERDIPSLYNILKDYFPVGTAIWKGDLEGEHAALLKKHFNSITSENDMKFASVEPLENQFDFAKADAQVAFAKANKMLIRGHTLAWHEQTPAWVFQDANGKKLTPNAANKTLVLKRLENHIRKVIGHFGADVYAWDVVNEVIDPNEPDGFRRSDWYNLTGTDFIKTAFRTAREVAPNAKLFINEYSTTDKKKRKFLYDLIADLKKQGIPVDGVGHQMHENLDTPTTAEIIETINLFSGLGVDNQITELDLSVYQDYSQKTGFADYSQIDQKTLTKQGDRYRDFFAAFKSLKGKITGVTFWSYADNHSWLTKNKNGVQILLWNYAPPITEESDQVFYKKDLPSKNIGKIEIRITDIPNGNYQLKIHKIGYGVNDVYTNYLKIGAPTNLSREQVKELSDKNNGQPIEISRVKIDAKKTFNRTFELRENDVLMFTLEKIR